MQHHTLFKAPKLIPSERLSTPSIVTLSLGEHDKAYFVWHRGYAHIKESSVNEVCQEVTAFSRELGLSENKISNLI